jgi:hypothetical protein
VTRAYRIIIEAEERQTIAMSTPDPCCAKCQAKMEEGFILDHSHTVITVATWASGLPEKTIIGSMKLKGKQQIPLRTFRCTACGYVESYAK